MNSKKLAFNGKNLRGLGQKLTLSVVMFWCISCINAAGRKDRIVVDPVADQTPSLSDQAGATPQPSALGQLDTTPQSTSTTDPSASTPSSATPQAYSSPEASTTSPSTTSSTATPTVDSSTTPGDGSVTSPDANAVTLMEQFDQDSCLRHSSASAMLTGSNELILTMKNGGGQGLFSKTELTYGRYTARIKTDVGGGAVVAFYLMGVDSAHRNDASYSYLHDEIDIELVGTLYSENQYIADRAIWFNAYHHHSTLILAKSAADDSGGSMLAVASKKTNDDALFNRHVLPEVDRSSNFIGVNFNDGSYYIYTIDYGEEQITYSIADDAGTVLRHYTMTRNGSAWPQTKMYLAFTIWSTTDSAIRNNFTGYLDSRFGRAMTATVDYVSYQPTSGTATQNASRFQGKIPWAVCP